MISEFDLNKNDLHEVLSRKGIQNLFHANTVSTSITFLNEKNLLSRKYVEDNNLFQTKQYTDEKDKKFGIWDDIFLDAMDIHTVFNRHNKYGPFLFSFNLDLLKSDLIHTIRITKMNPSRWKQQHLEKDRYYSDLNEFNDKYKRGNKLQDVGSMFILKDLNGKLPLRPFLNKIILDNPNLFVNYKNEKTLLANILKDEIDTIISANELNDIPKELRHKHHFFNCSCWSSYNYFLLNNFQELKRLFHTSPNS
jgi:Zn-finger nucleic acid-binding protein